MKQSRKTTMSCFPSCQGGLAHVIGLFRLLADAKDVHKRN